MKISVILREVVEFPDYFMNESELMACVDLDEVRELSNDMEAYDALLEQAKSRQTVLLSAALIKAGEPA